MFLEQQMDPAAEPFNAPSRANLRKMLSEHLKSDSELDAFLIDYFPQVKRLLANSHDRTAKINILFEQIDETLICNNLLDRVPSAFKFKEKKTQPQYDELESLHNELDSCIFADNTLLDVMKKVARTLDANKDWSPNQIMGTIRDVLRSNELVDRAYWWLCVYGIFRFKDIDKW